MFQLLHSRRRLVLAGAALLTLLAAPTTQAQCPVAAQCTPGRASSPQAALLGLGIANVTLGTINNTTANYADGYRDYSCTLGASLSVGVTYPISVRNSNVAGNENVRVWIDFDNNGDFLGTTELVFSSNNATQHTGTISIPSTATLGQPLRMRVSSDYVTSPVPTSCSTPQYSQVEDYRVTVTANSSPPVAAFTTDVRTTCTGCIQFTDASQNIPTAWLWTFGDGTTSTQQNPRHCYATPGTYNVTLRATNAAGNNTSAASRVTYNGTAPVAASCSPATTGYCCGYGITRVRLGTIDNTSADGSAGYQDFTCTQQTVLTIGTPVTINLTTGGTLNHDTRVYIDGNGDGTLTAGELVYTALNTRNPSGTFNLPAGATTNQPLRLRIVTDFVGATLQPCTSPTNGQVEDYTVTLRPNTSAPTAAFTSNYVPGACINPVQFTDQSTGAPTSWLWNFGDGSTSTQQNPNHRYTSSGTYTVTLTTTNANGMNTVTRTNYVTIQVPCVVYCPSNGAGQGGNPNSPLWLTRVGTSAAQPDANGTTYPAFSSSYTGTVAPANGYTYYDTRTITLRAGQTHTYTGVVNINFVNTTFAWIDYNRDGFFQNAEILWPLSAATSTPGSTPGTYTNTFTVPEIAPDGVTTTPGTTRLRIQTYAGRPTSAPDPCQAGITNGDVQDYPVVILPRLLGVRAAFDLPTLNVYPNPTADGRLHLSVSDLSAQGTYSITVQNLLGATLLHTTQRLSTADTELDLSSLSAGVYVLQLRDAQGRTALRRVVRE